MTQSTPYALLYDGRCRFCTSQSENIARYDDEHKIALLDLNDPAVRARFPQITPEDAQREMHLVAPDGTIYRGAAAVRQALLLLPALRGLGELMRIPGIMNIANPVYAFVARNRYLLGGRTDTCDDGTCDIALGRPTQPPLEKNTGQ
ncbi:MAG: DUF393 domain-containing protein [Chloroflexaceae bacterium]|jgi:predicted DCC family thiol-disulfide oxidoreductase YuxK|nr:DUF393 domain-containing protein [Chloroflexaceae bacterium]